MGKLVKGPVRIVQANESAGIDPEDLPYIFDMFRRGKSAGETEGSGVGLAVVKAVVEAHGGRFLVESKPGEGSTFRVILPKSEGPERDRKRTY